MPIRFLALLGMTLVAGAPLAAESLTIHEWGTFTAFQDEDGSAIGGINVDDEPVPAFVHDAAPTYLRALTDRSPALTLAKGWPRGDRQVTMRLETPVLYVHPGTAPTPPLNISVAFRGGWLTQFYPRATVAIPGQRDRAGNFLFAKLDGDAVGTLHWPAVQIGGSAAPFPATTAPVWLAPRQVEAAPLTVGKEGERYLFYRGIGHLDAPVRVRRSATGDLSIDARGTAPGAIRTYWLVDIRPDGTLAFRVVTADGHAAGPLPAGAETFAASEYTAERRSDLRQGLRSALIADGLFADEADAMLNTWQASYFRSPGLRLFFLTPRAWTEQVLPLTVTPSAPITRTMVGRIELISPAQRAALAAIAAGPTSTSAWFKQVMAERVYDQSNPQEYRLRPHGQEVLDELSANRPGAFSRLGLAVPADYRAFLDLGRFREALLAQVLTRKPAAGLVAFAKAYGLDGQL